MTDESIFNDGNTPPVIEQPKPPVIPDSLKELVGEGKKYATVEKALESIPHAQAHIARIEQEANELRQRMAEAKAAEEVYAKLMETMNGKNEATPPTSGLDEASVAALFDRRLAEREAEAAARANVEKVKKALVTKYGDKAEEIYKAKADELGVGVNFLNDVVRRSPKAAEELFGIKPAPAGGGSSTGSLRTDNLSSTRPPQDKKPSWLGGGEDSLVAKWRKSAVPES